MMNLKTLVQWLYRRIYNYNVFIPEEDDYDDNEVEEPADALRRQRYTTRLYILLLVGKWLHSQQIGLDLNIRSDTFIIITFF
jgi:hypothetical protein